MKIITKFTCLLLIILSCSNKEKETLVILIETRNESVKKIEDKIIINNFVQAVRRSKERKDVFKFFGKYYVKCIGTNGDTITYNLSNELFIHDGKIFQSRVNLEKILLLKQ